MATELLIDGNLSGTGVRDAINGGYVELEELGLSSDLARDIKDWQQRYEGCHFADFPAALVASLDQEGLKLSSRLASELPNRNVEYFSHGLTKRLP